jgi:hypothetical protein
MVMEQASFFTFPDHAEKVLVLRAAARQMGIQGIVVQHFQQQ